MKDLIQAQEKEFEKKFYDHTYFVVMSDERRLDSHILDWHKSSTKALLEAVIEELNLWLEEKIHDVKKANLETVEGELSRTVAVEAFKRVQDKLKEEMSKI